MIGFLEGSLAGKTTDGCLLNVAGVGYRLTCSTTTMAALPPDGHTCRLWTHLHVREDALSLFGFESESEQRMFEALLGVAGVGPKVAVQVCSAFSAESFRRSLVAQDTASIASVPGIGKKTAERILLELKDKLGTSELEVAPGTGDVLTKARSALENLGYSSGEVRLALSQVDSSSDATIEAVIKAALQVLA
ncbi:MAG: holliday junction helicase RuvA [Actinomycetota bacterium]|nr:holliday junction helicase RuvA [Actinomycetota bacterium]